MITISNRCAATCFSLCVFAVALFSGCNSKEETLNEATKFFGMTYFNYQQIWKRPPANWEEILTLADRDGLEADLAMLNLVRESDYVIIWNVDCQAPSAQDRVLAYKRSSQTSGGSILFADGSLRSLAANELNDYLAEAEKADEPRDGPESRIGR
jgi:hypothetical protein